MLVMFFWTILAVGVASNWIIVKYVHIISTEFSSVSPLRITLSGFMRSRGNYLIK
jgi:hypothetical protein